MSLGCLLELTVYAASGEHLLALFSQLRLQDVEIALPRDARTPGR